MSHFTVLESTTLLSALSNQHKDSSKTTLRTWLKLGRICIDDQICKVASTPVEKNQIISMFNAQRLVDNTIPIVYQDSHLIVLNKPHGLLSVDTDTESSVNLHGLLKDHFYPRKMYIVHRLDCETSGLIIFAKSQRAQHALKKLLEDHSVDRRYVAIIQGSLKSREGTWTSFLQEDQRYFVRSVNNGEGKKAITHFETLKKSRNLTHLKLRLETGRKNQIRVHCSEAGHPIVGDRKYGAEGSPLGRLGLHAYELKFTHPFTSKAMTFNAPLPKSFQAVIKNDDKT